MKTCIVLLVLLSFCASAQKKIETAFGQSLGAVLPRDVKIIRTEVSNVEEVKINGDIVIPAHKRKTVYFTPPKKFRKFREYSLLITPKTSRIYTIRAEAKFRSDAEGKRELQILLAALEDVYSMTFRSDNGEDVQSFYASSTDKKNMIHVQYFSIGRTLILSYVDWKLEKIAELEGQNENMDSSML